jgi:hypothetical protein
MLLGTTRLFHVFFMPMAQRSPASHVRCAIHANRKTAERELDEHETDFENQRRACSGVLRAGFLLNDHASLGRAC